MIRVENVSKSYQDVGQKITVLNNISFTLEAGKSVALMGQSGSGKSTLLHLLGGFDRPDCGKIFVNDKDIVHFTDVQASRLRREDLAMVFQQFNLIPSINAFDNICFVAKLAGRLPDKDVLDPLIDTMGLSSRLNHMPHQLSGGEQQRVAIARALAFQPKIILADEPTGNLDEATATIVLSQLLAATSQSNTSLLVVTHSGLVA